MAEENATEGETPVPISPAVAEKILVVDEDPKTIETFSKLIASVGYIAETSGSTEEALEILKEKGPFAVVVSENMIGGVKGGEFLKKVKKASPTTVRVLATPLFNNQIVDEGINGGEPYRSLKKPVESKLFVKVIQECARKHKENKSTAEQKELIERLNQEHGKIKKHALDLRDQVKKLKKTLRLILSIIGFLLISSGAVYGFLQYQKGKEKESSSVKMGVWVLYKNRTAVDTTHKKMWMTVDFRNVEQRAPKSWDEAVAWKDGINKKEFAGFTDWRIPTLEEYRVTYDSEHSKMAYDNREDYRVGYPKVFENGGGYGYWASDSTADNNAGYFFFIGGYDKFVERDYNSPAMSTRLVRDSR